MMIITIKKTP